jgi:cyclopropane-fatty-acyl-phospholipid synthase
METSLPSAHSSTEPAPARALGWSDRIGMFLLRALFGKIIRVGTLTIIGPDGSINRFGGGSPMATIRITDPAIIPRLFLKPDLAFGEAYMAGTLRVESGDIYDVLDLCMRNMGRRYQHWPQRLAATIRRLGRRLTQYNPAARARRNVAHHYDLSDRLYDLFLDQNRQYSCAYYAAPDDTLEQAQARKIRHLTAKLLPRPGQRVLDIGSGWGGLALNLARDEGVDVTGLTLSTEQRAYAQAQAEAAGLADRVRFHLRDYRQETGTYDRIISVGMFEHVGIGHYPAFFRRVRDLLTDDGVAVIHTIGNADGPSAANPWITKYIFPGGYSPALSEIVPVIERLGLFITDIEVLRLHYAETLKEWRRRFMSNRDQVSDIYDERFCRMWEFYLAGCEAAFRHGGLVVFQIQLSKSVDAVPITRDYIGLAENGDRSDR